jgi:hypothetical protein
LWKWLPDLVSCFDLGAVGVVAARGAAVGSLSLLRSGGGARVGGVARMGSVFAR